MHVYQILLRVTVTCNSNTLMALPGESNVRSPWIASYQQVIFYS